VAASSLTRCGSRGLRRSGDGDGCNRVSRAALIFAIMNGVWGFPSSVERGTRPAHQPGFRALRRWEMLSAAERSLEAAAAAVHHDPEAALDDILAARALIAAVLTVEPPAP
jgi:hypothetical protein